MELISRRNVVRRGTGAGLALVTAAMFKREATAAPPEYATATLETIESPAITFALNDPSADPVDYGRSLWSGDEWLWLDYEAGVITSVYRDGQWVPLTPKGLGKSE